MTFKPKSKALTEESLTKERIESFNVSNIESPTQICPPPQIENPGKFYMIMSSKYDNSKFTPP